MRPRRKSIDSSDSRLSSDESDDFLKAKAKNIDKYGHAREGIATGPPPYSQQPPPMSDQEYPPSGYRVPLTTDSEFPDPSVTGPPVTFDADGESPIFIGSALLENSVHPCKIGQHLQPFVSVAFGGGEYGPEGRYDLLPFNPDTMEWVATSYGQIPEGRRPIEGGYEDHGAKLYHGLAEVDGVKVPGKTAEHLYVSRLCQSISADRRTEVLVTSPLEEARLLSLSMKSCE
ncbi:hypothetical protein DXG03_008608 [Asterophora parasitica]|uniref:Uncharacterized protein n=1 Tax=Asterophora parasitica TaxID=117018 RepID=A0A9P7GBR9_9AGAR|nr:hypothetical protein DXG03_008608 [Asterophora parasitica]